MGCEKSEHASSSKIFSTLNASKSGIDFSNDLTETDSLNYFTYTYLYMGGGVATGDINNDGLIDVFFTGNQVSNKLYLNKGNLTFKDITESAGVGGDNRWYTGVTMADVNSDGFLDIYCSVSGKFEPRDNQLFINNGNGTFTERAKEFGVADIGHNVQGTFFDYDKDGDLDLYVANYPPTKFNSPVFAYVQHMKHVKDHQSDHLYRNDGGHFTDVTKEAGVMAYSLTLSATVGDLNNDSWPDIYISNDFSSPDFLYLNNQDGTFKEVVKQATNHTAFYGMGADISDFNNDGNLDIFQVDMDAENHRRQKANMASMNPKLFWDGVNAGFHYQYMHNCLQVNSGVFKDGMPHFSNVSRMTGTSSTDWSWGPLFADFDNDGLKDLFISNGTRREINNNDYFNKIEEENLTENDLLRKSMEIPSEKIDNFMYRNKGDFEFQHINEEWGIEYKGFSNGVVYADLDNDGDLEIITNNIDDTASVFENHSSEIANYIKVKFIGHSKNKHGIGNRVYITSGEQEQMQELTLSRGFQSSVAPVLHFGLGKNEIVDELRVVWADGKEEVLSHVVANQEVVIDYNNATHLNLKKEDIKTLFMEDKSQFFPTHKHVENNFDDFESQVLLPHKMSNFGPALAVGDLNKDGLDDYFVGGASTHTGQLFYQTKNGFVKQDSTCFIEDKISEDVGALIFDADNDGDNDLYVVSGGYEFAPQDKSLQDRLYINDGTGGFTKATKVLPEMPISGSKVYHTDFDKDGKEDLLVLGRQKPKAYPHPESSYLLKNVGANGASKFEFFNDDYNNPFKNMGMATGAVITDFNNDDWPDIIVVGEWMPIRVFQNVKAGFVEVSEEKGLTKDSTGWWWDISEGDFDNDGDMDYIVGNNGLNYKYKATPDATFDIFVNDFDKNNKDDIVLSYYEEGTQYPVRGRGCSSQQIPGIKQKFKNYESFANASLVDVYTEKALESSLHYQVKSFASIYLENDGDKFIVHELPVETQISSINKILVDDFDKDQQLDALIVGNLYSSEVETPRNDASHGLFLRGQGNGKFNPRPASESGFFVTGDSKDMVSIKVNDERFILVARNNDTINVVKLD